MGVKGLKSYIESSNNNFLRFCPFRNSRLIIDGCNLYYSLYFNCHLDQIHGGDYDVFEDLITEFFQNLRDCDISPFVVLDGGSDHTNKKFETLKSRHQDKIKLAHSLSTGQRGTVLPLLIKNVFRQTLHKLKVPLVQCIEEADWEIAALAKQWNCPVLSNDSDFYIFDLPAGIIPIQYFEWKSVSVDRFNQKKFITSKHFTVERFCASFNNMSKDLLPLFACILGNDYVKLQNITDSTWTVHTMRGDFVDIKSLLTWLSRFSEPETAIDDLLKRIKDKEEEDVTREALFKGMREYKLVSGYLSEFFNSGTIVATVCTGALRALPCWSLRPLLEGKMSSFIVDVQLLKRVFMTPQVEDFELPSSSESTRPIRQVLYGLLLLGGQQTTDKHVTANNCHITEYDREGLILTSSKVEAVETKVKDGLKLETLCKEPHRLRLQVLLDTLGVSPDSSRGIPLHLQLHVFVTRYWLVNAQPQPSLLHLWALLLGMVYGTFTTESNTQTGTVLKNCDAIEEPFLAVWFHEEPAQKVPCSGKRFFRIQKDALSRLRKLLIHGGRIGLDLEVAHLYSQWQRCLGWSLCLNSLLCRPVPEPECARLYRGTLVHQVVRELERGITPESLLVRGSSAEQLFQQLSKAVLSLVDQDDIRRIRTRHERRAVSKTQTGNRGKNQPADDLSTSFNHLMTDDIEDCDDDFICEKGRKTQDQSDTLERSCHVRTRHKVKARNIENPSRKSERRCFE